MASRQGFRLCKSKRRDKLAKGYGGYCLMNMTESDYGIMYGGHFQANLDQIETHLDESAPGCVGRPRLRPLADWHGGQSHPPHRTGLAAERALLAAIEPGDLEGKKQNWKKYPSRGASAPRWGLSRCVRHRNNARTGGTTWCLLKPDAGSPGT